MDRNLKPERRWCAYFYFVGWNCLSLGLHIDVRSPNLEIHMPFGFFKIGFEDRRPWGLCISVRRKRTVGWGAFFPDTGIITVAKRR
jgi:hypothetical protein